MSQGNFHEKIQDKLQDAIQLSDENVLRLEKGKRGLLNVLFGRTTVILLMMLVQIGIVVAGYQWLEQYMTYFYIFSTVGIYN